MTSRADMRSLAVVSPCFYEAAYPYVQGGALDAFLNALISPLYLYIEVCTLASRTMVAVG